MNQFNLIKNKSGKEKLIFGFIFLILIGTLISFVIADDWPMFRHDDNRTGISGEDINLTEFGILWRVNFTGQIFIASPAVSEGVIFIGSHGSENTFRAINFSTGGLIWSSLSSPISGSAIVGGGKVYIGGSIPENYISALNVTTGTQIWNFTDLMLDGFSDSPLIINGIFYTRNMNQTIYALNVTTGTQIWNFSFPSVSVFCSGISNSVSSLSGIIYLAASLNTIYALNATDGSQIWNLTLPDVSSNTNICSSPLIYHDKLFLHHNDFTHSINLTTGILLWNVSSGIMAPSPATVIGSNNLVYSFNNSGIMALNESNGDLVWSFFTNSVIRSSPSISEDVLFLVSGNFQFYALNKTDGTLLWTSKFVNQSSDVDYFYSSPAISNGKVYVGGVDGFLYAFGPGASPSVTLNSPASLYINDTATTSTLNVAFNCSATDETGNLESLNLYLTNPSNSSFALNQTTAITGLSNESDWTVALGPGNYTWNCLANDTLNNQIFATLNRSLILNFTVSTCTTPVNDLSLTSTTILCNGTYYLNDTGSAGVISFGAGNINLTCNNTIIVGNSSGIGLAVDRKVNVSIFNCEFRNYSTVFYAANMSGSLIQNNTFSYGTSGLVVANAGSIYNILDKNNVSFNQLGILIQNGASFNNVTNNMANNNSGYSAGLSCGIGFISTSIANTTSNIILNNTFYGNEKYGILLYGTDGFGNNNNTIYSNNISESGVNGIYVLQNSTGNLIYNNFFSNANNTYDLGTLNSWNTTKTLSTNIIGGANIGGNYYSDYVGTDANSDGIGDIAYTIQGSNVNDSLPITNNLLGDIAPIFYSYFDDNASLIDVGIASFNVSVNNTNGTVLLQINSANYSATNLTSNVYNVSLSLTKGNYNYSWISFGAGSQHTQNTSVNFNYQVNDSSLCIIPIDGLSFTSNATLCNGTYYANDSISDGLIKFSSDNITVNCNGTKIIGNNSGIVFNISGKNYIQIKNCFAQQYDYGINLFNANYSLIYNNTLNSTTSSIIVLGNSTNNLIYNNNFTAPVPAVDNGTLNSWNSTKVCNNALLPNSGSQTGWMNMSGNVLLLHMDNAVNGTGQNIVDSSGNGNNGTTYKNMKCNVEGKINGSGCYFRDSMIEFSNSFNSQLTTYNGGFTVSAWVYFEDGPKGTGRMIAGNYIWDINGSNTRGWYLGEEYGIRDIFSFRIFNSSSASPSWTGQTINKVNFFLDNNDKWTHVVAVFSPSNYMRVYANGVKVSEKTTGIPSNVLFYSGSKFYVGGYSRTSGLLDGRMDEFAFWNRTLSESEILGIYNNQSAYLANVINGNCLGGNSYSTDLGVDRNNDLISDFTFSISGSANAIDYFPLTNNLNLISKTINFTFPTLANNSQTSNLTIPVNYSISGTNISKIFHIWNGEKVSFLKNSTVLIYNFNNNSAFGENESFVYDTSGNNHNGTIVNAIVGEGRYGNGSYFNNNSYIAIKELNYSVSGEIKALTVCAWVKTNFTGSSSEDQPIVSFDKNYYYSLYMKADSGKVAFTTRFSNGKSYTMTSVKKINDDGWHHVCATFNAYDGYRKRIFIDGNLESMQGVDAYEIGIGYNGTTRFGFIGVESNASTFNGNKISKYFNGNIDEVVIFHDGFEAHDFQFFANGNLARTSSTDWNLYMNQFYTIFEDASYFYKGCVEDIFGNENCTSLSKVTKGPPSITISSPGAKTYSGNSVLFNVSLSSAGTECVYSLDQSESFPGRVAQYKFEDYAKDWVNRNHGGFEIPPYIPASVTGYLKKGYYFNGIGTRIYISNSKDISDREVTQRTLSVWFKTTNKDAAGSQMIYAEGNTERGMNIYINSSKLFVGAWNTPSYESNWAGTFLNSSNINSNQWHNVVLWLNGTSTVQDNCLRMYLDGVNVKNGSCSKIWPHGSLTLGRNTLGMNFASTRLEGFIPSGWNSFSGTLDELVIYNSALTDSQILALNSSNLTSLTSVSSTNFADTVSGLSGGSHKVIFYCTDDVPNTVYSTVVNFGISLSNLTISLLSPTDKAFVANGTNLYFNYTVNGSALSVDTCKLYTNTSDLWSVKDSNKTLVQEINSSFVLNVTSDGNYLWNIWCNLSDGTEGFSQQGNLSFTVDSFAPAINISYPLNGTIYGSRVSYMDYGYNESNPDSCSFSTDGGQSYEETACGSRVDELSSQDGSNSWSVCMNDSLARQTCAYTDFNFTTPNMTVKIILPGNVTYNTSTINFNVSLEFSEDTSTGSDCVYSLNGASNTTMTKQSDSEFYSQKTGLADSGYNSKFSCVDSSGFRNSYENVDFSVAVNCVADSSCQASTCTTATCTDVCGNSYTGTKDCPTPPPCFLAETKILMANKNYKNIEDVKIGDKVISYNQKTKINSVSFVEKTFVHDSYNYLIVNEFLKVTSNHPMLINGNWEDIGNAKIGDKLQNNDGNNLIINSIEKIYEKTKTYNLQVSENHNYYAENILVHNKGGGGKEECIPSCENKKYKDSDGCEGSCPCPSGEICEVTEIKSREVNPETTCSAWGDCLINYSLTDILLGKINSFGVQSRVCQYSVVEQRVCVVSKKITLEKTEWCSRTSLNLFEQNLDPIIAKIKLSNSLQDPSVKKMGIYFTIGDSGLYCDYCYDGVKNYDEENVDCGGPNCPSCFISKKYFDWVFLFVVLLWVLVAGLIFVNLRNFRDDIHFFFLKNSSFENRIERTLYCLLDFKIFRKHN